MYTLSLSVQKRRGLQKSFACVDADSLQRHLRPGCQMILRMLVPGIGSPSSLTDWM